jgi:acetyl-CoA acetyltransferase
MALTAENLAEQYRLDRKAVDAYALRSQVTARHAQEQGWLAEEIVPVTVQDRKGNLLAVDRDEGIRETSAEALAKLPSRFRKNGVVTAGNASGINDAGCALVLTRRRPSARRSSAPICSSTSSTASRSTRLSRRSTSPWSRSSGWTATRPTSTAGRSRWATRWPPAARG